MQDFIIMILGNDFSRLLNRILIIFNRRNLKIISINVTYINKNSNYFINFKCYDSQIVQIVQQIKKLIGVSQVIYKNVTL